MKKNVAVLFTVCISIILVIECISLQKEEIRISDSPDKKELADFLEIETSKEVIANFKRIIPSAKVEDYITCDLDENGEEDYIILFSMNNGEKQYSSCLAVCLYDSNYSAVALSSEKDFEINSVLSFEFIDDKPKISVELRDPQDGTVYLYTVDYTYDENKNEANYRIEVEILE